MSRDALVVGINTYQYLPSLKAPARDAEAIAEQLHSYGEFRVHRLPEIIHEGKPQIGQKTRVTLRELETALINLFKPKGRSIPQTAIFYFSGHGIQRDAGIQEGYLALSDSNPEQGFYGLSLFWLRRLLQESPVRQRVIWLDCCHSGEFLNFLEADPGAHPGTDRLFMAASREYETAYESLDSEFSVFTDALLTGLDPSRIASGIVTNHSLTDWVNLTLKGEIQQPLFESSGSEIILTRRQSLQPNSTPITTSTAKDICPYRGLEFFDESHSEYFFGREELIDQLVKKLSIEPFVAVVGASGSGKSSLIRAGLMIQLRQGRKIVGSNEWKIRLITPTDRPLKSLATAFIDPELSNLERAEQLRRAETFLQHGGDGLSQLVRASLSSEVSTGLSAEQRPQFLLVIDQFEEIFTLSQGSQAERERQEFFDCLLNALSTVESLKVVLVLRADFLSKCALYEGLMQQLLPHQIAVPPLKYEQIKAAIVRPAKKVGLICEPNLVYTMMMDVIGAPGELPLLQSTLLALWQKRRIGEGGVARLTLDAYQELGGVRGTLQKQATEAFYNLSPEEQTVAKRIFLALTQLGEGTEDTRRRVVKAELVSPTFPIELVERVLEKLVAAKLVITGQTDSGPSPAIDQAALEVIALESARLLRERGTRSALQSFSNDIVDVVHEALIRNWPLLRSWLNEGREVLRRQRRIELAAQEWHRAGQPATGEYLLHGLRLRDAEDFLRLYPQELSALAQHYIDMSYSECRRARRTSRQLRIAIPSVLVATLTIVLSQYYGVVRTQTEKDDQLQKAVTRERVAIAQAVLQDAKADPMAALLISRLAAETEQAEYDAQATLRKAIQNLRLQSERPGHQGPVQQIVFSPDRQYLGSAGADGTIRLWTVNALASKADLMPHKALFWDKNQKQPVQVQSITFSPDGKQLAAIAQNSGTVKIWSVASGELLHQLIGSVSLQQVGFSPDGKWLTTVNADREVTVWQAETGLLQTRLSGTAVNSVRFSSNHQLLVAREDGNVQIWQLETDGAGVSQFSLNKSFSLPEGVEQAEFSSTGRWTVVLGKDGKVGIWNNQAGRLERLLANNDVTSEKNSQISGSSKVKVELIAIKQVKLSLDEQTIATIDSNHQIKLWNIQSGHLITKLGHEKSDQSQFTQVDQFSRLQFSPDQRLIVTTSCGDHAVTVCLWNRQGQQVGQLGHQAPITAVEFSADGAYIITATLDGKIHLWMAELGGELPTAHLAHTPVEWLTFLPSSSMQGRSSAQAVIQPDLISANPTAPELQATGAEAEVDAMQLGESFPFPMLSSLKNWMHSWFPANSAPTKHLTATAPDQSTEQVAAGSAQPMQQAVANLVTVSAGQLRTWEIVTPVPTQTASTQPNLPSHFAALQLEQESANVSSVLATLGRSLTNSKSHGLEPIELGFAQFAQTSFLDLMAEVHLPASWLEKLDVPADSPSLSSFAVSPNGLFLATADIAGGVTVYRIETNQSFQKLYYVYNWKAHSNTNTPVSEVVPLTQLEPPTQLPETPTAIRYLTFSPDSQQLLGIADDLTMRSWRTFSGKSVAVFQGHTATIRQAHYSKDGQSIVSASWDRSARIWQAHTGRMIKVLPHQDAVSSASFSPSGQRIVTASWDGTAQVWQINDSKPQLKLHQHQKSILDTQFSPDGQLIVTASADGTARLWNSTTGETTALLQSGNQSSNEEKPAILQAAFSPDGQFVTTLDKTGKVNLWAATKEMLLQIAYERSLRQLTPEECRQYLNRSPEECPKLPS